MSNTPIFLQESEMKNEAIKISVIIPIYNAKEYISRCLDSLLNQTLREIEIICVLDCPTDGTDKIVEAYAQKDARIVVLCNEKNMHVSQSRNRGMQIAQGEYIGFHDHDDYNCDTHMYEDLYNKAKEEAADVVLSDAIIRYTRSNKEDEIWRFVDTNRDALLSSDILPMLKDVNPQMLSHCVWSSIYRKEFLMQNNITFKDRQVYLDEDRLFNFEVFINAEKITYIPKAYYVWEQLSSSISHNFPAELASRQISRTQFYVDYLKERGSYEQFQKDIWELLSLEIKIYWSYYSRLSRVDRCRLGQLMISMNYPMLGYKYRLKIVSKKRLQLIVYNVKTIVLYLLGK